MSIAKLDGGTTESHGETPQQRVHLQLRSGKLHNGKRVGAHGSPHHLRNGGDFGFLEGIPENRRGSVDRTPTHDTHLCSTVCSQARNAHTTCLARELHCHLCAPENSPVIWCVPCLILGCSLTCHSPRALHLPHSLFLLPRHKNTQHNRYTKFQQLKLSPRGNDEFQQLWTSKGEYHESHHSAVATSMPGNSPRHTTDHAEVHN